jgi:hypothetical protein
MEVFEGPQIKRPRVSLLSSADLISMESERWSAGFDLITEGCEDTRVYAVCPEEGADPKEFTAAGDTEPYQPYMLYATDHCSTWPAERKFYDRAQRKLEVGESTALEEQLWTGEVAGTVISPNPNLQDSAITLTNDVLLPHDALAVMDQAIGDCSATQGMIHIRPMALPYLVQNGIVRSEGNVYLSPMDNIVVPGRGYPGTGPAGTAITTTEWMYGHPGIVQIRRGPIIRLSEGKLEEQVQRATNDRLVVVERVVHVALDPTCCVYAIEFPSLGPVTTV